MKGIYSYRFLGEIVSEHRNSIIHLDFRVILTLNRIRPFPIKTQRTILLGCVGSLKRVTGTHIQGDSYKETRNREFLAIRFIHPGHSP